MLEGMLIHSANDFADSPGHLGCRQRPGLRHQNEPGRRPGVGHGPTRISPTPAGTTTPRSPRPATSWSWPARHGQPRLRRHRADAGDHPARGGHAHQLHAAPRLPGGGRGQVRIHQPGRGLRRPGRDVRGARPAGPDPRLGDRADGGEPGQRPAGRRPDRPEAGRICRQLPGLGAGRARRDHGGPGQLGRPYGRRRGPVHRHRADVARRQGQPGPGGHAPRHRRRRAGDAPSVRWWWHWAAGTSWTRCVSAAPSLRRRCCNAYSKACA